MRLKQRHKTICKCLHARVVAAAGSAFVPVYKLWARCICMWRYPASMQQMQANILYLSATKLTGGFIFYSVSSLLLCYFLVAFRIQYSKYDENMHFFFNNALCAEIWCKEVELICDITDNFKANPDSVISRQKSIDLKNMCAYSHKGTKLSSQNYSHMFQDFYEFEENRGFVRDSLWFY